MTQQFKTLTDVQLVTIVKSTTKNGPLNFVREMALDEMASRVITDLFSGGHLHERYESVQ